MAMVPYNIPNEPGIFIPSPLPAFAPQIYSKALDPVEIPRNDILYLFTNFSPTMWIYLFIALLLCSVILIYFDLAMGENSDLVSRLKSFYDTWYDYFMLFIDNSPTTISKLVSSTILWTFIVLGFYYGFHMIFMSTLSADLASSVEGQHIETLYDLIHNPIFSNYTPSILAALNMPNALKYSNKSSDEGKLYDWIMRNESISVVSMHTDYSNAIAARRTVQPLSDLLSGMRARERCVIEDSSIFNTGLIHVACHLAPQKAMGISRSKDVIAGAAQAVLLSHSTHPEVVKLVTFRSRASYELGITTGVARNVVGDLISRITPKSVAGYECGEIIEKTNVKYFYQDWAPMGYSFFWRLAFVCLGLLFSAFIALIAEGVHNAFKNRKNTVSVKIVEIRKKSEPKGETIDNLIEVPAILPAVEETISADKIIDVDEESSPINPVVRTEIKLVAKKPESQTVTVTVHPVPTNSLNDSVSGIIEIQGKYETNEEGIEVSATEKYISEDEIVDVDEESTPIVPMGRTKVVEDQNNKVLKLILEDESDGGDDYNTLINFIVQTKTKEIV